MPPLVGRVHDRQEAQDGRWQDPGQPQCEHETADEEMGKEKSDEPCEGPDLDAVWDSLVAKRSEWHDATEATTREDFVSTIRGGSWTKANKGLVADTVQSKAKKGLPQIWCRQYGMNIMASFAFSRYGEPAAVQLSVEWCRRMQHWFNPWLANDDTHYQYVEEDLASYCPKPDWEAFVGGLEPGPVKQRAEQVAALCPPTGKLARSSRD